ncbi:Uu.00g131450.m01.CDS01 [Anthostomella pinea]|uniref:Uu.00g131450.m01.CDS01 n=1 Tax=Anthostomella pinea TaxID=933095 RepID=A0AAI8VJG9_9PEZI|nr:Uu.00g131450.m01.CDS01 [Anthostomella pinea]
MPDLNSVPASPHALAASRRASSTQANQPQMPPPPASTSPSLNILPSNQEALQHASPGSLSSPPLPAAANMAPAPGQDNTGVGAGPGPLRHPRPLTAAELHSEVEQEQELLVNRLTRDLTLLRAAQNSSVVSNTSSTSASTSTDQAHPSSFTDTHLLSGPGFPIPTTSADRRHHRTSSSTSGRSVSQVASQGSIPAPIPIPQAHSGSAASVLEAARNPRGAPGMSRQSSRTSHRSRSRNRSPHYGSLGPSSYTQQHGFPHDPSSNYFLRGHTSSNPSIAPTPSSELSPGLMPATMRYEETAHFRHELESAKNENENLKRRVKELEKILRERRESDASLGRGRSESTSTTASVSVSGATGIGGVVGGGTGIAGGRNERRGMERAMSTLSMAGSVAVGVPDDELRVGESAASTGLRSEAGQTQETK